MNARATVCQAPGQKARPPLLAEAFIEFDGGQASLVFDGCTREKSVETSTGAKYTFTLRTEHA